MSQSSRFETPRAASDTPDDDDAGPSTKRPRLDYHHRDPHRALSHADYTVGWICALHIEMAAAHAMLDVVHASLPLKPADGNTYAVGSIGSHNVVIACLPSDQYGTNNAAMVASDMRRSFPGIRVGLMVGIGGGVPSMADVRLGDVVVGSGVVQHDLGKTMAEGQFHRTGTPRIPPSALMTAVAKLRALHEGEPSKIPFILSSMLQRNPSMERYTHRATSQDNLFEATYDHVSTEDKACHGCDSFRLVSRPPRVNTNPYIHYGHVASGNLVLKHGITRDVMARELGVLCFEMEAAGLVDSFPCLAIRGICDYCDTHKNKQWQEYAAATAAAYAKELLSVIPADEESAVKDCEVSAPLDTTDIETRMVLLESLKFDQIDSRRLNIKPSYRKTCRWLLDHAHYVDWLDPNKAVDHHGFLWIKGNPGTGKSTLMSFAHDQAVKARTHVIISFFFSARGHVLERSIGGMYRSLLFQLLSRVPKLVDAVTQKSEHIDQLSDFIEAMELDCGQNPHWQTRMLQDLMRSAVAELGSQGLMVFVDALDECEADEVEEIVEYFEMLGEEAVSSGTRLTICFSSRHYPHVDIKYGQKLVLEEQQGHERDIATYINSRLKVGKGKTADEMKEMMQEKAKGIFMWVILVVEILNAEFRGGRIFSVRIRLNALPSGLCDLFQEILSRDKKNRGDLGLSAQWILFARRPLTLEEYYFAVVSGLAPDQLREWDPLEVTRDDMMRFVLSSSKGLAETTRLKCQRVQFIHESVREFFLKEGLHELWPDIKSTADFEQQSHSKLQQCCQAYMELALPSRFEQPGSFPKASSSEARDLRKSISAAFPFLEYATSHVFFHADAAPSDSQVPFLEQFPLSTWIDGDNLLQKYDVRRYTQATSFIYIFAEKNLTHLIRAQLERDPRINIEGERHRYPIFAALAANHQDAVKALLLRESNVAEVEAIAMSLRPEHGRRFQSPKNDSPLEWAIIRGHVALAEQLIARENFVPTLRIVDIQSLLFLAAKTGRERIFEVLLATKGTRISVNTTDSCGQTLLSVAAISGHAAVIKMLLDTGECDVDGEGYSELMMVAILQGNEAAVKVMLDTGKVNVIQKGGTSFSPLSFAAAHGNMAIVNMLLERDTVNINARDEDLQTPLHYATTNLNQNVTKLLLETGTVEINAMDKNLKTPLHTATEDGTQDVVKLLLETDRVDINARDQTLKTPLHYATEKGYQDVIKLLLRTDTVDINARDQTLKTPLHYAVENRNKKVVELLLNTDMNQEI
ncbi:hypothetical protein CDD80_6672 [Ophiocordyceps camponoti-rufipedis]|uniref:Uncharacterized protein n=1 Tax=Ophiocordyceps camponoti-rufipedis TaxID=2004952 RepID=A0A2C5ZH83_9HYPO|nr:hypothetical protein CDD80_6672 [Ophiocordyceps camponoti-rufipedis]